MVAPHTTQIAGGFRIAAAAHAAEQYFRSRAGTGFSHSGRAQRISPTKIRSALRRRRASRSPDAPWLGSFRPEPCDAICPKFSLGRA
jgi:hypothetical protein